MWQNDYNSSVAEDKIFKTEKQRPVFRKLRCYAFDPSLSSQLETSAINLITCKVAWEDLKRGPIGEYLEVIDIDPASGLFYDGIDLDNPLLLAQDGLFPSESNPGFHQQMVYAVAMNTIQSFEKALGRRALWSGRYDENLPGKRKEEYIQRLRIYPHAIREANAYYSPVKKALLFGYFPASTLDITQHLPGGMVFTCLSQDIIVHETTHALLDGMHRRFIEPTHPDTLAFHEAFADIVALFQHFSMKEVLIHQIAKTKGDLTSQSLLGELAQEFGKAIGNYGALRSAIGKVNPETKKWELAVPDPEGYKKTLEPHARGAILVSAIFEAFISIYNIRVKDLFRIASGGTGILPEGELHPTLVKLLANEAAKAANHVLSMCIRALDYCPPVDITFGDYLRAIITADKELVAEDPMAYRIAMIDAFRRRGILPEGLKTLSVESLIYPEVIIGNLNAGKFQYASDYLRKFQEELSYTHDRSVIFRITNDFKARLHDMLEGKFGSSQEFSDLTGLLFCMDDLKRHSLDQILPGTPPFEVHSIRMARRVGPDGNLLNQIIIGITQQINLTSDSLKKFVPELDDSINLQLADKNATFKFRGGATIIIDLDKQAIKYSIKKPIIDRSRLIAQIKYQGSIFSGSLQSTYFSQARFKNQPEPLALLHRL